MHRCFLLAITCSRRRDDDPSRPHPRVAVRLVVFRVNHLTATHDRLGGVVDLQTSSGQNTRGTRPCPERRRVVGRSGLLRVNACVNPYMFSWISRHHCIIKLEGRPQHRDGLCFSQLRNRGALPSCCYQHTPGHETGSKTLISGLRHALFSDWLTSLTGFGT